MKSFKRYLIEAVADTRRQNMIHFQDMKPIEFIQWAKQIERQSGGILRDLKVTMKVDGLGARFGKDPDGRIFFEGSRTGPVFDDHAFSNHAISKGADVDIVARARKYDDMLTLFKNAEFMKVLPNDRKVVCEIFYNPMAKSSDTGLTFVTVEYDKSKLGTTMTIVPYGVLVSSTGQKAPDETRIKAALMTESTSEIKFVSAGLAAGAIDVHGFINPIAALDDESIRAMLSRKAVDAPLRNNVLQMVNAAKQRLADYLLAHPAITDKFKLGPNIEGIVLHDIRGKVYKITTPEFKQKIHDKKVQWKAQHGQQ